MLALLGVHQQNVNLDYIYMCQATWNSWGLVIHPMNHGNPNIMGI